MAYGPSGRVRGSGSAFALFLLVIAGLMLYVVPTAQAASGFGFNYWPYNGDNRILGPDWPNKRAEVAADLDHIASLGGGMIRVMVWPGTGDNCDWPTLQDRTWCIKQNQGGTFTSQFTQEKANVADLIRLAYERDIKVIFAFGNYYITCGPDPYPNSCVPKAGTPYWFEWAYDNTPDGDCGYLQDAATWVDGYVSAIEASPYRSAVMAYDFQNEVSAYYDYGPGCVRNNWDYLKYLYDHTSVPRGKRGVSILCVTCPGRPNDALELRNNVDPVQYRLDLVDFHSYSNPSHNADIAAVYDSVKSYHLAPTVILGEFGHRIEPTSNPPPPANELEEAAQATAVTSAMQTAQTKGIPYYLHWQLWDRIHQGANATFGFGYKPDEDGPQHSTSGPRSVLGSVSSFMNATSPKIQLAANPDMETVVNGKPQSWSVGTTTIPIDLLTLQSGGPYFADAATNKRYARVKLDPTIPGYFWLVSNMFNVTPGKRLTTNAYLRSNLTNSVQLWVNEYNSSSQLVRQSTAPAMPPPNGVWRWRNYLQNSGAWSVVLTPTTTKVTIGFVAQGGCWNPPCPSYLDVDAVSAAQS